MLDPQTAWYILVIGVFLSFGWARAVLAADLSAEMFANVLQKIIRAGNVSRALKLTAAADEAPVSIASRAAIRAALSREEDQLDQGGYRGGNDPVLAAVKDRIRARYDEAFAKMFSKANKRFILAPIGLLLLCLGLFVSVSAAEIEYVKVAVSCVALLAWLYFARSHLQIRASRNACFEALWPSFLAVYQNRHALTEDGSPIGGALPSSDAITFDIIEPGIGLRSISVDEPIIKIGTHSNAHVLLSAPGVARLHAVMERADGLVTVIDLGSERQTQVNGVAVNKQVLQSGDVLTLGDAEIVVRLPEGLSRSP